MYSEEFVITSLWEAKEIVLSVTWGSLGASNAIGPREMLAILFEHFVRKLKSQKGVGKITVQGVNKPYWKSGGSLFYLNPIFGSNGSILEGGKIGCAVFSRCLPGYNDTMRAGVISLDSEDIMTACLQSNGQYAIFKNGQFLTELRPENFPFGENEGNAGYLNLNFVIHNLCVMSQRA